MNEGFLSEPAEIHALAIGLYEGFKDFADFDGLSEKARENEDVAEEMHYAKSGYVVGAVIRVVIYVLVTKAVLTGGL